MKLLSKRHPDRNTYVGGSDFTFTFGGVVYLKQPPPKLPTLAQIESGEHQFPKAIGRAAVGENGPEAIFPKIRVIGFF